MDMAQLVYLLVEGHAAQQVIDADVDGQGGVTIGRKRLCRGGRHDQKQDKGKENVFHKSKMTIEAFLCVDN